MANDQVRRTAVSRGLIRRRLACLLSGVFAVAVVAAGSFTISPVTAATTIAPTTTCSNHVDNTPGLGLICQVTVVNTITATGGSASVRVRECHGPSGVPATACTITTLNLGSPVTNVTQCNNSGNGGGGNLRCTVRVTNNFVGLTTTTTPVSVNQCVGSAGGGGISIICSPFPATTTGATITQCNGSANGGGLVAGSTCTATGTKPSSHGVTINQCNGSVNGGGSKIVCSARITNNALAAPRPSATPTKSPKGTPTATPKGTPTATPKGTPTATPKGTPTATPKATPTATPTARPTARPTGSVSGVTATPKKTLPPTSMADSMTARTTAISSSVLAALAFLVSLSVILVFRRRRS